MILLIDNYDSFPITCSSRRRPSSRICALSAMTRSPSAKSRTESLAHHSFSGARLSAKDAGICEEVVSRLGGSIPILGVCLGHQAICEVFGGRIEHAQQLMHGKQSIVEVDTDEPLFKGLAKKTMAARYHSLVAAPDSLPDCLKVISRDEIGEIMAVRHKTMPIYGVQFHPESILTPQGTTIMQNFLKMEN